MNTAKYLTVQSYFEFTSRGITWILPSIYQYRVILSSLQEVQHEYCQVFNSTELFWVHYNMKTAKYLPVHSYFEFTSRGTTWILASIYQYWVILSSLQEVQHEYCQVFTSTELFWVHYKRYNMNTTKYLPVQSYFEFTTRGTTWILASIYQYWVILSSLQEIQHEYCQVFTSTDLFWVHYKRYNMNTAKYLPVQSYSEFTSRDTTWILASIYQYRVIVSSLQEIQHEYCQVFNSTELFWVHYKRYNMKTAKYLPVQSYCEFTTRDTTWILPSI
jgi:hypothetical protein